MPLHAAPKRARASRALLRFAKYSDQVHTHSREVNNLC